ncbi:hypothetical protein NCC49_001892 [Naganishia albida]|nr:hypothetical protein NCC49_001892 [Naganishia albida]
MIAPRHAGHTMDMGSDADGGTTMAGMKMYFHAGLPSTDTLLFQSWVPGSVGPVIGACIGLFFLALAERFLAAVERGAAVQWRRDALRRLATSTTTDKPPVHATTPSYASSSTVEEKLGAPSPAQQEETTRIVPVLHGPSPGADNAGVTHRLASRAVETPTPGPAPPPSYLPQTVVRALTDPSRRDRYSIPFIWRNELARGGLTFVTRLLGYVLMLVAMTFNIWFIIAVCLGAAVGETLFGRHGYMH